MRTYYASGIVFTARELGAIRRCLAHRPVRGDRALRDGVLRRSATPRSGSAEDFS